MTLTFALRLRHPGREQPVADGQDDGAASAFYSRLFLFLVVTLYGSIAVVVFDAFWPRTQGDTNSPSHRPSPA